MANRWGNNGNSERLYFLGGTKSLQLVTVATKLKDAYCISDGKVSACNVGDLGSIPGLGRYPGEGSGNPPQYSCLEKSHGLRILVCYSPWGLKESDTTEWLHFLFFFTPWKVNLTNLDSMLKSRDITLPKRLWFFQWSCMDVRVWLQRKLRTEELMLLNCGVAEDAWDSLGLQGDPTSSS